MTLVFCRNASCSNKNHEEFAPFSALQAIFKTHFEKDIECMPIKI